MTTNLMPKNDNLYFCESCHFKCCKLSNYNIHISTRKHKILQNTTGKNAKNAEYICLCNKVYKHHSSLWNHKKKCNFIKENNNEKEIENNITPELILDIIQQNQEFKELLIIQNKQNQELQKQNNELTNKLFEVCKNGTNNNITNTNSHNKSFNLNFFLNETCKDAMNIMDFVDSIKLQLSDLENVGKIGFVEGISDIIVKNLNSLDETKRPVHCTDSKREVMYVKDENKWEKENETRLKLRKAIKKVAHKNTQMLCQFRTKHPDCLKSESKVSDKYNKLVFEAMGGKGDNDSEKEDKIIKNIAKEVIIEK
jgi:hypothetical protein